MELSALSIFLRCGVLSQRDSHGGRDPPPPPPPPPEALKGLRHGRWFLASASAQPARACASARGNYEASLCGIESVLSLLWNQPIENVSSNQYKLYASFVDLILQNIF